MPFWKQFALCIVVILAGFAAWVYFVPGAGETMRNAGVPDNIVSRIAPKGEEAAEAGAQQAQGGQGQGQNAATAVVAADAMLPCSLSPRPWYRASSMIG